MFALLVALAACRADADVARLASYVPTPADASRIDALVRDLGSPAFKAREDAEAALAIMGPKARRAVASATTSKDAETRKRATRLLRRLGSAEEDFFALPAVVRRLAAAKAPGAAKAVLDALPHLDADTAEEVVAEMPAFAFAADALTPALKDAHPLRRSAAGTALAAVAARRADVRKLLADPDAGVRRRVGLALLANRDREAIPALVGVLSSAPAAWGGAEAALQSLAGDDAPEIGDAGRAADRAEYVRAWGAWWKQRGPAIDLAKLDPSDVGRGGAVVGATPFPKFGVRSTFTVHVFGPAYRLRWRFAVAGHATSAVQTRYDRVVVADTTREVSERDRAGRVLWKTKVDYDVCHLERLADGKIVVVTAKGPRLLSARGDLLESVERPSVDVVSAKRHDDGSWTLLVTYGDLVTVDAKGKVTAEYATKLNLGAMVGFRPHWLPGGGVLVPAFTANKVVEVDARGRKVAETPYTQPLYARKLAGDAAEAAARFRPEVSRIDRATGKVVSVKSPTAEMVWFIDRR